MRLNTAFKKSQQMGDLNIVGDGVEFLKQYLPIAEGTTEYDANIGGSLSRLGNSGLTDMFDAQFRKRGAYSQSPPRFIRASPATCGPTATT